MCMTINVHLAYIWITFMLFLEHIVLGKKNVYSEIHNLTYPIDTLQYYRSTLRAKKV